MKPTAERDACWSCQVWMLWEQRRAYRLADELCGQLMEMEISERLENLSREIL